MGWPICTGAAKYPNKSTSVTWTHWPVWTTVRGCTRILGPFEQSKHWNGRPVRALQPFNSDDGLLLEIVSRGEFMIRGICNKDLQGALFPQPASDSTEAKRRSGLVSRKLRLLRAHGIIRKIAGRNLYQVSPTGRLFLTTFLIARQASANQLMKSAKNKESED